MRYKYIVRCTLRMQAGVRKGSAVLWQQEQAEAEVRNKSYRQSSRVGQYKPSL